MEKEEVLNKLNMLVEETKTGSLDTSHWRSAVRVALKLAIEVVEGADFDELMKDPNTILILKG